MAQDGASKTTAKTPEQAGKPFEWTFWGQARRGFDEDEREFAQNRMESLIANSMFNPRGYGEVLKNGNLGPGAKAGYAVGRAAHDLLTDGSRVPYWALNHPLAITGVLGEVAAQAAGLSPDYNVLRKELEEKGESISRQKIDEEFAKRHGFYHNGEGRGIPLTAARFALPAMATGALTQLAGNTNYLNLLGGGRLAGYAPVLPSDGDPTQSENPALELAARYVFGRTGRLLPWEQFHAERPDIPYSDYAAAAAHQFDKGLLGIGLLRGTTRNLEGEPEATMMGFRVPFSAATGAAGLLAGGVLGAKQADSLIGDEWRRRAPIVGGSFLNESGNRRLLGATIGGVLGAIAGKLGGVAVNGVVIQPLVNPERVAAKQAWQSMTPEQKVLAAEESQEYRKAKERERRAAKEQRMAAVPSEQAGTVLPA